MNTTSKIDPALLQRVRETARCGNPVHERELEHSILFHCSECFRVVVSAIRDAIRPEIAAQVRQELPLREAYKAFAARCDDLIEGEDMSEYAFLAAWKEEVEARLRPEGEK